MQLPFRCFRITAAVLEGRGPPLDPSKRASGRRGGRNAVEARLVRHQLGQTWPTAMLIFAALVPEKLGTWDGDFQGRSLHFRVSPGQKRGPILGTQCGPILVPHCVPLYSGLYESTPGGPKCASYMSPFWARFLFPAVGFLMAVLVPCKPFRDRFWCFVSAPFFRLRIIPLGLVGTLAPYSVLRSLGVHGGLFLWRAPCICAAQVGVSFAKTMGALDCATLPPA